MSRAEQGLSGDEYHAFIARLREATGATEGARRTAPVPTGVPIGFTPRDLGPRWSAPPKGYRGIDDYSDDELIEELLCRLVRRHKEAVLSELGPELAKVFVLKARAAS